MTLQDLVFENADTVKRAVKASKIMKEHDIFDIGWMFSQKNIPVEEKIEIAEMIKELSKEEPMAIGLIENGFLLEKENGESVAPGLPSVENIYSMVLSKENLIKRIEKKKKEYLEKSIDRVIDFSTDNYTVKQLVNQGELFIEASIMKHCVAGYGPAVIDGTSIIISVRNKNKKREDSFTVELRQERGYPTVDMSKNMMEWITKENTEKKFFVGQVYSAFNKLVNADNEIISIFNKFEETFEFQYGVGGAMFKNSNEAEKIIKEMEKTKKKEAVDVTLAKAEDVELGSLMTGTHLFDNGTGILQSILENSDLNENTTPSYLNISEGEIPF
jgi:hypothetical protein